MSILRFAQPRFFALLLPVLIFGATIYGFAASNTVPTSIAGDGEGTISGVTVGSVDYVLNQAVEPATVTQVNLNDVTYTASTSPTVKIELVNGSNSWYTCTAAVDGATGDEWTCAVSPALNSQTADQLRVLANN